MDVGPNFWAEGQDFITTECTDCTELKREGEPRKARWDAKDSVYSVQSVVKTTAVEGPGRQGENDRKMADRKRQDGEQGRAWRLRRVSGVAGWPCFLVRL